MSAKRGLPPRRRMRHDRHFVDELTQRMGEGIGRMIRIDAIASSAHQPRSELGNLEELVASVAKHGVIEPLLVRREAGTPGYELVAGERRYRAALRAGLKEVPCIELEVSDQEALELALVENLQRQDLDPFEEADGFRRLVDKYGYTHDEVAAAVGRSRVTVTESLRLLAIPERVRKACRHADINAKGLLLELAKAPDVPTMEALVAALVEQGVDRARLRELRHRLANGEGDDALRSGGLSPNASRRRPFVVRFRHPERAFSVALSFRTEREPEANEVIAALEEMIRELREDLEEDGGVAG